MMSALRENGARIASWPREPGESEARLIEGGREGARPEGVEREIGGSQS